MGKQQPAPASVPEIPPDIAAAAPAAGVSTAFILELIKELGPPALDAVRAIIARRQQKEDAGEPVLGDGHLLGRRRQRTQDAGPTPGQARRQQRRQRRQGQG